MRNPGAGYIIQSDEGTAPLPKRRRKIQQMIEKARSVPVPKRTERPLLPTPQQLPPHLLPLRRSISLTLARSLRPLTLSLRSLLFLAMLFLRRDPDCKGNQHQPFGVMEVCMARTYSTCPTWTTPSTGSHSRRIPAHAAAPPPNCAVGCPGCIGRRAPCRMGGGIARTRGRRCRCRCRCWIGMVSLVPGSGWMDWGKGVRCGHFKPCLCWRHGGWICDLKGDKRCWVKSAFSFIIGSGWLWLGRSCGLTRAIGCGAAADVNQCQHNSLSTFHKRESSVSSTLQSRKYYYSLFFLPRSLR